MSFKMGFLTGAALGYLVGTQAPAEQRSRIDRLVHKVSDDPRVARTRAAVSRNTAQVADTVTDQVTDAVDRAGDAVDSFVGDSPSPRTASSGTHVA